MGGEWVIGVYGVGFGNLWFVVGWGIVGFCGIYGLKKICWCVVVVVLVCEGVCCCEFCIVGIDWWVVFILIVGV